MKIVVFNFRKYKLAFKLLETALLLALAIAIVITGVSAYTDSNAYIEALQSENEKRLVIIDAGHGGEDPGAIGVNGVYEKDLNLEISRILGEILTEKGFAVFYTRTEDALLYTDAENIKGLRKISDLKNRCKIAAEFPNAIFVSIHMNSYSSSQYSGLQVYYTDGSESSAALAGAIQSSVKGALQPNNNRSIRSGKGIYILDNIVNTGVLVECGFLTNPEECEKLSEKEYQKQLCSSIVSGIINYKEKTKEQ